MVLAAAADEERWCPAALALCDRDPPPALLLALHRPPSLEELLRVAAARPAILLAGAALEPRPLAEGAALPPLRTAPLATGLGLPVVASPDELVEAAWLRSRGARQRAGRILTLTAGGERASLLENLLQRIGLRLLDSRSLSRPAFSALTRAARRLRLARSARALLAHEQGGADALLIDVGPEEPALRLVLPGAPRAESVDEPSLRALAALLALPPEAGTCTRPPPPATVRRACARLDGWSAELSEAQLKPLLAGFGLASPPELLAGSASRATRAAAAIGLPVVVKAVGPTLEARTRRGALVLGVETAAGARQAFHDVLDACARLVPAPTLDGVLVSRQVPMPFALDLALLWPGNGLPPVLLLGRRRIAPGAWTGWGTSDEAPILDGPLALPAPLSDLKARWASRWLLRREVPGALRDRSARSLELFLSRFSWLGPALAGRMRWLRLDTVSPPDHRLPPLVIDARGLQTASLRDPLAALQ
jgi:hypothetical protein